MTAFDFLIYVGFSAVGVFVGTFIIRWRYKDKPQNKKKLYSAMAVAFLVILAALCWSDIGERKFDREVFESEAFLSELEEWARNGYDEGYYEGYRDGLVDGKKIAND